MYTIHNAVSSSRWQLTKALSNNKSHTHTPFIPKNQRNCRLPLWSFFCQLEEIGWWIKQKPKSEELDFCWFFKLWSCVMILHKTIIKSFSLLVKWFGSDLIPYTLILLTNIFLLRFCDFKCTDVILLTTYIVPTIFFLF